MSAMLKVVEKEGMENKNKALDAALAQIERDADRRARPQREVQRIARTSIELVTPERPVDRQRGVEGVVL